MTDPISAEARDRLALRLVPGLGPRLTAALLERFGSPGAVRRASAAELREVPHIGDILAQEFATALKTVPVDEELERIRAGGASLIALGSPAYPAALAQVYDPPPLLFVRGTFEVRDAQAIAIVGSRQCTSYGKKMAERIATGLARAGYTIVSGLARGIDGVAHRAALAAGGRTLAVLAGGLARLYPPEHKGLADEIAAAGAVLTEAPMTMEPLAGLFPGRNRLISGLSRGVVIVEAAERSGALITVRHAAEQDREVFAVPGPADSEASSGTLALIRQGARMVRSAEDVLEDLEGIAPLVSVAPVPVPPDLTPDQQRIWECLSGGARQIDDITQQTGLPVGQVSQALLEMKKQVRRLPGNQYERR